MGRASHLRLKESQQTIWSQVPGDEIKTPKPSPLSLDATDPLYSSYHSFRPPNGTPRDLGMDAGGVLGWTGGGPTGKRARSWSPRTALGTFSIVIIVAGSVVSLAILSLLCFLWLAEGPAGGAEASSAWRRIMLGEYITPVVTICCAVLRMILAGQALIITSLIAALLLEQYGVPILHVAEISILRSVNSGPLRLMSVMLSSKSFLWKVKLPALLTMIILLSAIASQFASTLLVSDLSITTLVGNPQQFTVGVEQNITKSRLDFPTFLNIDPAFVPYGELSGPANTTTPNEAGLSDTGPLQKIFIPLLEANRSSVRSYRGKAYIYAQRHVCMRPEVSDGFGLRLSGGSFANNDLDGIPSLGGNISIQAMMDRVGLAFPEGCENGTCWDNSFNCTLPFEPAGTPLADNMTLVACYPTRLNILNPAAGTPVDEPLWAHSEQVFFIKSNFTTNGRGGAIQQNVTRVLTPLRTADSKPEGEFATWEVNGMYVSMSVCFLRASFRMATVALSAPTDLPASTSQFDAFTETFDLTGPMQLLGYSGDPGAPSRGLYNIDSIGNFSEPGDHMLSLEQGTITLGLSRYTEGETLTMLLTPNAFGTESFEPNIASKALFQQVFNATGRPGLAFDALMTPQAKANIDNFLSSLVIFDDSTAVASVVVLVPRHTRGLVVVTATIVASLLCVVIVTAMFLSKTRYSMQGDCWHVAAQIFSEETRWILDDSTEVNDRTVAAMMSGPAAEMDVKIGRSFSGTGTLGRVQVVPHRRVTGVRKDSSE